jgi:hypothetical protein
MSFKIITLLLENTVSANPNYSSPLTIEVLMHFLVIYVEIWLIPNLNRINLIQAQKPVIGSSFQVFVFIERKFTTEVESLTMVIIHSFFLFSFLSFWMALGFELGASCLLSWCSYCLNHSASPFLWQIFFMIGSWTIWLSLASNQDPPDYCLLSS